MNAPRDKSYDESLIESLKDPAEAAAYVDAVLDLDDPAALLVALRQVAKAHEMAEKARGAEGGDQAFPRVVACGPWPLERHEPTTKL